MKKVIGIIAMLMFIISSIGYSQSILNYYGQDWLKWDEDMRIMYIVGYMAGLSQVNERTFDFFDEGLITQRVTSLYNIETECYVSVGWLLEEVGDYYNRTRNWDQRITDALFIVLGKPEKYQSLFERWREEDLKKKKDS